MPHIKFQDWENGTFGNIFWEWYSVNIKNFKYAWRYTDSNYALFSLDELSKMNVLLENESSELWDKVCDSEIFQESCYIRKIIDKNIPVYVSDCGWGDELEEFTQNKLIDFFKKMK